MACLQRLPSGAAEDIFRLSIGSAREWLSIVLTCSSLADAAKHDRRVWASLVTDLFPEAAGLDLEEVPPRDIRGVLRSVLPRGMLRVCGAGTPRVNGYYEPSGDHVCGRPSFRKLQLPDTFAKGLYSEAPVLLEFCPLLDWSFNAGRKSYFYDHDLQADWPPLSGWWSTGLLGESPPPCVVTLRAARAHPSFASSDRCQKRQRRT